MENSTIPDIKDLGNFSEGTSIDIDIVGAIKTDSPKKT